MTSILLTRSLAARFALGFAVLSAAAAVTALAQANAGQTDPIKAYSTIGIVAGQTLRLGVVNVGGSQGVPPDPCFAQMGFVNSADIALKTANVTIQPGDAAFLAITFQEAEASPTNADSRSRVNVRPVVNIVPPLTNALPPPCRSISSSEVFDAVLDRTSAFTLPVEGPGAVPLPAPLFGVTGITAFDTLRLNVTNVTGSNGTPPDPCNVQMGFVNAAGAPVRMASGIIDPGHTGSVAINYFEALSASPSANAAARIDLRPWVSSPPDPCRIAGSVELVDTISGQTRIGILPAVQSNIAPPPTIANTTAQ